MSKAKIRILIVDDSALVRRTLTDILGTKQSLEESSATICQAIKAAAAARLHSRTPSRNPEPKLTADAVLPRVTGAMLETTEKVVVVASTGGTEALRSAGSPACRRPRHRDRAAHARMIHPRLRRSSRHSLRNLRQGGRKQRPRSARTRPHRARQPSSAPQA